MSDISIKLRPPLIEEVRTGTVFRLGYPGPEAVSQNIADQIDEGIATCLELARPAIRGRSTPFTGLTKTAVHGENLRMETVNWTRLAVRMTEIREIYCFAITLGGAVDDRIRQLGKTAMVRALMLDSVASVMADQFADQIQKQCERFYQQQGLTSSARFSPGYCDWPMKEGQAALIPFLQPEPIGITASDTGLMTPRKSITAVVIAAERMPAVSPCFLCGRECDHRRTPYTNSKS